MADETSPAPETPAKAEIALPPAIAEKIRAGAGETLERVRAENPALLIVLKRSGAIAFTAVAAMAETATPPRPLPDILQVALGREITDEFTARTGIEPYADTTLMDVSEYAGTTGESARDQLDALNSWLEEKSNTPSHPVAVAVEHISAHIRSRPELLAKLEANPTVMIIDDATGPSGATMEYLAPWVVKTALAAAGIDQPSIKTHLILPGSGNWRGEIIDHSFPLDPKLPGDDYRNCRDLLSILIRGETEPGDFGSPAPEILDTWEKILALS